MQEKLKLIDYFEFLRDKEASKPLDEMDTEQIDAYVKILLNLQDKCIELSPEFINEQVRKIFHTEDFAAPETAKTTKKHFSKKKAWLVAACIAILMALFSIISFSSDRSVVEVLEDFFGDFEFIPAGAEVTLGNDSFLNNGRSTNYTSFEDAAKGEKLDFLAPSAEVASPECISLTYNEVGKREFAISFDVPDFSITIESDTEMTQEIIDFCNDEITLNGVKYYLCIMEDVNQAQAHFVHNNNLYIISHSDEISLLEILNNMEEINYEN